MLQFPLRFQPESAELVAMPASRRDFVRFGAALPSLAAAPPAQHPTSSLSPIDRRAVVTRHSPVLTEFSPRSPLSVGNGEFAFTADVTGLQTFPALYEKAMPLCTQSQWGWHSFPMPASLRGREFVCEPFDTYGRPVGYATKADGQRELFQFLRENPHRLHLGQIGFLLVRADGAEAGPGDLRGIRQELDLWRGVLRSRFVFDGEPVEVETACHPTLDCLSVRIRAALLPSGRIAVRLRFPYASPAITAADWAAPGRHQTTLHPVSERAVRIARVLDGDHYQVALQWREPATLEQAAPHTLVLRAAAPELTLLASFAPDRPGLPPNNPFPLIEAHWQRFWQGGGAVDFSATSDPRAREIERRAVLSQYLTAIQCAGSMPPQETGLTCNSWYGKFHLEMHWWHAAHFPLWNRPELLARGMGWYRRILPSATATARRQGYTGARWPKMAGPDGADSPSAIGPLLIWQQPHPIAFAELLWRAHPTKETLERYAGIVFATAEFMASFAVERNGRYILGPPVIPAQENHPPRETWNPTFELEYWRHGLAIALEWRRRLGLPEEPRWQRVRRNLSKLPVREGVYLAHENCPETFTKRNYDHPSMLAALGVLPGELADPETMRRTLHLALKSWRWADTWGWDYPMTAMTATRLLEPEVAVDALLLPSPKNEWLPNGHNYQRPSLPLYLPGNGGLLSAVALMAAGWQDQRARSTPGFPEAWQVRHESLHPWL